MGNYVYKYVLNDDIIYIGMTSNLDARIASHGRKGDNINREAWPDIKKAEVYYIKMANVVMADVVEKTLILRYKPKYNTAYMKSNWNEIPFEEPEWIRYQRPQQKKRHGYTTSNVIKARYLREIEECDERNKKSAPILYKLLSIVEAQQSFETDHPVDLLKVEVDAYALFRAEATFLTTITGYWRMACVGYGIKIDSEKKEVFIDPFGPLEELAKRIELSLCAIERMQEYARKVREGDVDAELQCAYCTADCKFHE